MLQKPNQRIGATSNSQVGRDFENQARQYFSSQGIQLHEGFSLLVGVNGETKAHAFDLGCGDQKVIVECKSHRWTTGGNVPSAKLTVWNEAMYYFLAAPDGFRKVMFVLKDFSEKRRMALAEYYIGRYAHLIPKGVELWQFDTGSLAADQVWPVST
ncbi:MAG: hypothetical protein P8X74_05505 [Reinekea sp.]